jgi:predicted transcriptional regulator
LKGLVEAALTGANADAREAIEKEARALLFADAKCATVAGSRMRSAAPPTERSGVCNVLTLAQRTDARAAVLMALHDEVVVAGWALTPPSPRAHLGTMSVRVDDDLADTLKEMAAARPLVPVAAGAVAAFLYRSPPDASRLAASWQAFGEAPLDIAERELTPVVSSARPLLAAPHP